MCAIFGSKDFDTFIGLSELNSHRGSASYSIMGFSDTLNIVCLKKHFGELDQSKAKEVFETSAYVLAHIQDPTDGRVTNRNIHPAHVGGKYLYHNGMIRSQAMSSLDGYRAGIWDTELLLGRIEKSETYAGALDDIVGSFACALIDVDSKEINLFTNKTCSLYIDFKTMDISSTKKDKFKKIKGNKVYNFNPIKGIWDLKEEFNNQDDIYYIPGE